MQGGYGQMQPTTGMPGQHGFDSRAEQAFNQPQATAGSQNTYNGYGTNSSYNATSEGSNNDAFGSLYAGMGNLGLGDGERRNGVDK